MNPSRFIRLALVFTTAIVGLSISQASETASADTDSSFAPDRPDAKGKLIVCFASKGDYQHSPGSAAGLKGLTSLLHKYGFRGTYYLKSSTIEACQTDLQAWNKSNGDEVGWLSDGEPLAKAGDELEKFAPFCPVRKFDLSGTCTMAHRG